jgi:hypothetical protein
MRQMRNTVTMAKVLNINTVLYSKYGISFKISV